MQSQLQVMTTAALGDAHAAKCELVSEVLRSAGTLRLRVMGWSMLPVVWPGDTLVIEHVNSAAVSEGDIVLFGRDRRLFAHRVVKKHSTAGDSQILTRGDALLQPDPPVSDSDLLGRVAFILRNGKRIEPRKTLRVAERAVAALVRRSDIAARMVVGAHGMRQSSQD
jgi:signal peptidase I